MLGTAGRLAQWKGRGAPDNTNSRQVGPKIANPPQKHSGLADGEND
jgi:hypothetical protein